MCYYIGIEDLAANALIEILRMAEETGKSGSRFVTYKEIESYGEAVLEVLRDEEKKAVLILSRDCTDVFYRNYSDFFEEDVSGNGEPGIRLKEGKNRKDLISKFRSYLALDVLFAFVNEKPVSSLVS